jgi:hypothetical protein
MLLQQVKQPPSPSLALLVGLAPRGTRRREQRIQFATLIDSLARRIEDALGRS